MHRLSAGTGQFTLTGHPATLMVTMNVAPDLVFVQGRPFYEFVVAYLVASAGLTPVFDSAHYPEFMLVTDGSGTSIEGRFPGRIVPEQAVNLRTRVQQARGGSITSFRAESALLCMLANSAFEAMSETQRRRLRDKPHGELLRHVRNAASHGNRWHFGRREPQRPASWRGFTIDTRKGADNPLHGTACFGQTLLAADLLYLLSDVDKLLS